VIIVENIICGRRGRRGGYGRTGLFVAVMQYNKWYTTNQILKWFHSVGDPIKYTQAKAVFEALDRGKCHNTKKLHRKKHPAIMLFPTLPQRQVMPDIFQDVCKISIKEYLTSFLLTAKVGEMLNTIKRVYDKDDKHLAAVAQMHNDKTPIIFDEVGYAIAGWSRIDNEVHVMFEPVDPSRIYRTKSGKDKIMN